MAANTELAQVQEGAPVLDSTGAQVGTVEYVKMGDPGAVTTRGQRSGTEGGLLEDLARAFGTRELPRQQAERLLRTGFLKVDAKGLFSRDCYVGADEVAHVTNGTVHLAVTSDEVTRAH